jgi:hypothetical protein
VLEGNRVHRAAVREHLRGADDALRRPVASLGEHVGTAGVDQPRRRVLVEPGHRVHRREGRDQRHAVRQQVHRPPGPLAQAPRRGIAVQRDQQRRPERARPREIRDVAAVQQVEHAVGEHERARRARRPAHRVVGLEDLALERGRAGA